MDDTTPAELLTRAAGAWATEAIAVFKKGKPDDYEKLRDLVAAGTVKLQILIDMDVHPNRHDLMLVATGLEQPMHIMSQSIEGIRGATH